MTNEHPSDGAIPQKLTLPSIRVDCSAFQAGLPADEWTRGTFTVNKITRPPIKVDCSRWTGIPGLWLEIRLDGKTKSEESDPAIAPPLLDAARSLDPELNLVADAARSRREGNSYILALTPTADLDDLEERLAKLIGRARSLSVGGVRVTSAALCWAA